MARPKGVIQKRDESKYWLPPGVNLKPGQNPLYRKETKLIFIDHIYGEFESTFKALQGANASTHEKAVQKRRETTNINKYGCKNPSSANTIKDRRKNTFQTRYGVNTPLQHSKFLKKAQETTKTNFGVENPMFNKKIKQKVFETAEKNGTLYESYGEKELRTYIESLGFTTKKGHIGGRNPGHIDIVVEDTNIAFEFNGEYWHSEEIPRITPRYHLNKTEAAAKTGTRLIHIFEQEWIQRNNQVKSFIRSILGKNEIRIMARKCILKEVSKFDANKLLDECHILGTAHFNYAYGLYCNEELVSLVTIGNHHRGNNELILNRYVGKTNITVIGGLSRLTDFIKKKHGTVYTWVDRRISDGSNWLKCGWEVDSVLPPDYFYWDIKRNIKVPKQSRRKNLVNTPNDMTEHEHALKDGLRRVYDCGKIKLKLS